MNKNNYIKSQIKGNLFTTISSGVLIFSAFVITFFSSAVSLTLISQVRNSSEMSGSDVNTYITILLSVSVIIIVFSLFLLYSSFYIDLKGRNSEFYTLKTIGMRDKEIKDLSLKGNLVITITVYILSLLSGSILFLLFANISELTVTITSILKAAAIMVIVGGLIQWLFMRAYKNASQQTLTSKVKSKEQLLNKALILLGFLLIILSMVIPELDYLFIIGIALLSLPLFLLVLLVLEKVSKRYSLVTLFLTSKQLFFYFPSFKSVITSLIFAITLFVGMFSFYDSIEKSIYGYYQDNITYEYLITLPTMSSSSEVMTIDGFDDNKMAFGLVLESEDPKAIFYGVGEDFLKFEKIDVGKEEFTTLFANNENGKLPILIPNKKFHHIENISILENEIPAQVHGEYRSFNPDMVVVSKENLSNKIFRNPEMINVIWVKDISSSKLERFNNNLPYKGEVVTKKQIEKEAKESIINGTESVELFLTIFILFSALMIVNIIIIFYQNRLLDYQILMRLNYQRNAQLFATFLEVIILNLYSWMIGFPLGLAFGKGAIEMMLGSLQMPVTFHLEYARIAGIFFLSLLLTLSISLLITFSGIKKMERK